MVIEHNALDGEQRVDAAVADHIADGHIRAEVGVLPILHLDGNFPFAPWPFGDSELCDVT